jgi:hypothetical protein
VTKERTRANKKKQKVVWDAFKASQACITLRDDTPQRCNH